MTAAMTLLTLPRATYSWFDPATCERRYAPSLDAYCSARALDRKLLRARLLRSIRPDLARADQYTVIDAVCSGGPWAGQRVTFTPSKQTFSTLVFRVGTHRGRYTLVGSSRGFGAVWQDASEIPSICRSFTH